MLCSFGNGGLLNYGEWTVSLPPVCTVGEIFALFLPRLSKPQGHEKASSFQGFFSR